MFLCNLRQSRILYDQNCWILFAEIFHQIFEHFQRNIVFLCNLPEFFTSDEAETTLIVCLIIVDWRVLGVLLLVLLHPVLDVGLVPALLHEAVVPGPALVPLVCL